MKVGKKSQREKKRKSLSNFSFFFSLCVCVFWFLVAHQHFHTQSIAELWSNNRIAHFLQLHRIKKKKNLEIIYYFLILEKDRLHDELQ